MVYEQGMIRYVESTGITPLNFPGLWRWLFKSDYKPDIVRFVGSRAELEGPQPGDLSLLFQLPFDSRFPQDVDANITRSQVVKQFRGKDKLMSSGIALPLSWDIDYWNIDSPRTLGSLKRSVENGHSLPLMFDYPEATYRRMTDIEQRIRQREGEEGVRKVREVFKSLYGYDSTNYLDMPYQQVKELGRKGTKEEKEYGIKSQDWWLVRKRNGGIETLVSCATIEQINAVGKGDSGFAIFLGDDPFAWQHNARLVQQYRNRGENPPIEQMIPVRKTYKVTGARGADSEAANNLFGGSNLGRRYVRERTEENIAGKSKVVDMPVSEYNWHINGLQEVAEDIWKYIQRQRTPYRGVVIAVATEITNAPPPVGWIVTRTPELLDMEFLDYSKDGLTPIVTSAYQKR